MGNSGLSRLGEVQVWNVATGQELFDLDRVVDNVFNVAFSPDGTRLAAANGRFQSQSPGSVTIWDTASGQVVFTLRNFTRPVHGVSFSPEGDLLATSGGDGVKLFSTR
jgi:WD40 repeat protein